MKKILSIDIETYSSVDLIKCGVYRYVEAPDFEILLFAYAYDDEPITVIDLADFEELPEQVTKDLTDPDVIKAAYNANFERTCIAKFYNKPMPPEQWRCTSVHALTLGLPGNLDGVAKVLGLDAQKDTAGKNLIKYFSVPCKPTKVNGGRTRNFPHHAPDKWKQFKDYCKQDVVVERAIRKKIEKYPVPEHEWKLWTLDQKINDAGVRLDPVLVQQALKCDLQYATRLDAEAKELTGLDNPNSTTQLTVWLKKQGLTVDNGLGKDYIPGLLDQAKGDETVTRMLELRKEMSKTSTKKYEAMERAMCSDDRARGLLQFCGANRTWRWAGRLIQVQNLPQNKIPDLGVARELLHSGKFEAIELLFNSPPFVLSQLIRTAFIPSDGCRFIVSDFSAIEARVIAWLAGESWRMKVFKSHGKIYEASASHMFHVPIEEITKGNPLRQKGKIAELALGYGGSIGALEAMGALKMGLDADELPDLVTAWRNSNPKIVKLWWDVDKAAMTAVREHMPVRIQYGITFSYKDGFLFIKLPSGRKLAYVKPKIKDGKFGRPALTYEGMDQIKKTWERIDTYGPKLVENIVQAVARDCLAVNMLRLDDAGYDIRMHVHDEVILDVPNTDTDALAQVNEIMSQPIDWAPGLPLRADGYETEFYKKD
ncbi:DNA polymerase [Ruminiclostridium cellulolyticum]|uniref:DNA-directed DNA polymerase n=1 Tax=Ruminiclostridium cellulolyticum (strain ATCC 35319 / DSM 5812 / JCM 6584 / H10) TaxID=394503 RepID=B8I922_RUMCH|nr:DNA polymerase [Ruminiclostridium cellulolyticum]ACL77354.1 DNA-directed DNA polymerase [Ruminiclostridium cellulolyticum H10]